MNLLLELEHINLSLDGAKILSDISWQVHEQESWAVLGPNGSGKSTLLRLALGELRPDQNFDETGETSRQIWHIAGKPEISPIAVKQVVSLVSPELHNWYWEHGWQLSGEELLLTGLYASPLLYTSPLPEELAEVRALAEELELEHLLDYTVSEMSQGQLRRMLVARALIGRPLLLALDEVFEGLDSRARRQLTALLSELARYQTTILLTSHRTEDLPAFIRHALLLEDGKIVWQGEIMSLPEKPASGSCCTESFSSRLPRNTEQEAAPPCKNAAIPPLPPAKRSASHLLELKNVSVYLQGKKTLHCIDWKIKAGENWAILGENGSGKTTLLRCLWGEEHPALGGSISWFGKPGPHNQQWLHSRFGMVSDRLQASIPSGITAENLVVSGFFASIDLYEQPSVSQINAALQLMEESGLAGLAGRKTETLSYGQLRRLLLARALVHQPVLLLLDEPCSGLDAASRSDFLNALNRAVTEGKTQVIHATHHTHDLAGSIDHVLCLEQGRAVYQGPYPPP